MKTVLITIDALRADHLQQYGYERDTLSELDRLIDRGGLRYTNVYSNGTNTRQSVPSILTAQYTPTQSDVETGKTFPKLLQEAGIRTGMIHSNIYFDNRYENVSGFDSYHMMNENDNLESSDNYFRNILSTLANYARRTGLDKMKSRIKDKMPIRWWYTTTPYTDARETTDTAISWILDQSDKPFFLWVHYMDPHSPYGLSTEQFPYTDSVKKEKIIDLMGKAANSESQVSSDERKQMIDLYDSDIKFLDHQLSRLIDTLLQNFDNGLNIIVTSDHGEEFGDHGLYFHRNRPYEELIHVPFILYSSNKSDFVDVNAERQLVDIGPTICKWHGISTIEQFDGEPLQSKTEQPVIATGSLRYDSGIVAVRRNNWKYIHCESPELYNLGIDPHEQENIVDSQEDIVAEYLSLIPDHVSVSKSLSEVDVSTNEVEEQLQALGYLDKR